ncbi:MAG: SDR family NAD(P)-dependent oxidoreductase [Planctomycetota bacterium]
MPRRRLKNLRAIVTGASGGIGRQLALQLGKAGAKLVLVARDTEALESLRDELAPAEACVVAGDVTEPAARRAAIETAKREFGGLDLLLNNAGVGAYGRFDEASPDRLRRVMEVNFFAAAELIREAAPLLAEGVDPAVVNIGSILGCRGVSLCSEYNASKFALHGLSESIRPELRKRGIELLVVAPGATESGFRQNVLDTPSQQPWATSRKTSAEAVAASTLRALRRRRRFIVPSRSGWLMVYGNRLVPWLFDRVLDRYG